MLQKKNFFRTAILSPYSETTIKFGENFEFTCSFLSDWVYIKDVKGGFEITRIIRIYSSGNRFEVEYDTVNNRFLCSRQFGIYHEFYITANIEIPVSINKEPQESAIDDSRPESVIPTQILSNETTLLHKIRSNNHYADVYFITSNGKKISAHRNILAAYSDIFVQIFDKTSEIPVQIHVNVFTVDTIQSALDYLYDKFDAINGKEKEAFKFAVKFGIQHLIDACVSFFKDSINPTNVYEFIQIAYSNNFDELKQKCLQILVQKKEEIDPTKIAKLPSNILFDAFFFKM